MFDPYHKWLGIPRDQRPPTFYQLLAIAPTEDDPEVIDAASVRQSAYVRHFQRGPHAAECSRVLGEIALARATLLDPGKRRAYDATLPRPVVGPVATGGRSRRRPVVVGLAVVAVVGLGIGLALWRPWRGQRQPVSGGVAARSDAADSSPRALPHEGHAKVVEAEPARPTPSGHINPLERPGPRDADIVTSRATGMKLRLIPAGSFDMGSDDSDKDAKDDEKVQVGGQGRKHRVRITRPFYLGVTEVTVGQFRRVVATAGLVTEAERDGKGGGGWDEQAGQFNLDPKYTWRDPGFAQADDQPVTNVCWYDAVAYCNALSRLDGLPRYYRVDGRAVTALGGDGYRLPTEAEWEYACRAGTTTRYQGGDDPETLAAAGNVADATLKDKSPSYTTIAGRDGFVYTAPVGRFRANAFGLYDMHGNVNEWCWDRYKADYYKESPGSDPSGPPGAAWRMRRGGSCLCSPEGARSADRYGCDPGFRFFDLGFRVARNQPAAGDVVARAEAASMPPSMRQGETKAMGPEAERPDGHEPERHNDDKQIGAFNEGRRVEPPLVVAHWRFEEGRADAPATGKLSILDSSGNGLDGTPINGPIYRKVDAKSTPLGAETGAELALEFDGKDQRVFVADSPLFQLEHSLTLEAVIKVRRLNPTYEMDIVFRGDDRGGLDPYAIAVSSDGKLKFWVCDSQAHAAICEVPIPGLDRCVHVAGTLDGDSGDMRLYVDGRLARSLNTMIRPFGPLDALANPGLGIGGVQSGNYQQFFDGLIAEVRISDVALRPDQFLGHERSEFVGRLATRDPKSVELAAAHLESGKAFQARGESAKAIGEYTEAIRIDPRHVEGFRLRGRAHVEAGHVDAAVADYSEAIRLDPKDFESLDWRGWAFHLRGAYDKAIADYDAAIRLEPRRALSHFHRGLSYEKLGNSKRALANYNEAIGRDHACGEALYRRSWIYLKMGKRNLYEQDRKRALEIDPRLVQLDLFYQK